MASKTSSLNSSSNGPANSVVRLNDFHVLALYQLLGNYGFTFPLLSVSKFLSSTLAEDCAFWQLICEIIVEFKSHYWMSLRATHRRNSESPPEFEGSLGEIFFSGQCCSIIIAMHWLISANRARSIGRFYRASLILRCASLPHPMK